MKRQKTLLIVKLLFLLCLAVSLFSEDSSQSNAHATILSKKNEKKIELEESGPYLVVKRFGSDRIYVSFPLEPELEWTVDRALYSSSFEEKGGGVHRLLVTSKERQPPSQFFAKVRDELEQGGIELLSWKETKKLGRDVMDLYYIDQNGQFVRSRIFLGSEKVCTLTTTSLHDVKQLHESFVHGFSFVKEMKF